jgi:hypothetical protein
VLNGRSAGLDEHWKIAAHGEHDLSLDKEMLQEVISGQDNIRRERDQSCCARRTSRYPPRPAKPTQGLQLPVSTRYLAPCASAVATLAMLGPAWWLRRISKAMKKPFAVAALIVAMIVIVLFGVLRPARAETQLRTFYNDKGQVIGQATTRGNTTTFSNDKGQSVGRAERHGDTTTFYNEKGQITGTSREPARSTTRTSRP